MSLEGLLQRALAALAPLPWELWILFAVPHSPSPFVTSPCNLPLF